MSRSLFKHCCRLTASSAEEEVKEYKTSRSSVCFCRLEMRVFLTSW